jgi:hypothetical protein
MNEFQTAKRSLWFRTQGAINKPGANPTIVSYNNGVVKIYNATNTYEGRF